MPPRKSPGSSKCMTIFAPDRSTPSESPSVASMPNTPEHHSWSGLAGPNTQGHSAAQLHDSRRFTFMVQAMSTPFLSSLEPRLRLLDGDPRGIDCLQPTGGPMTEPIAQTTTGRVRGVACNGVLAFKGIPF